MLRQWQNGLIIITSPAAVNGRSANTPGYKAASAAIRIHAEQNLYSCIQWYAEKTMSFDVMFPDPTQRWFCNKCLLLMTL